MDENQLFYTFSTIPQILAGLIALLGVFWVYRISDLNKKLTSQTNALLRELDFNDKGKSQYIKEIREKLKSKGYRESDIDRLSYRIKSSVEQQDWNWIFERINDLTDVSKNQIVKNIRQSFVKIDDSKKKLTRNTKIILISSGIEIVLSVLILILVPVIDCFNRCFNILAISTNIILFISIIVFTTLTIIDTLKISTLTKN